MAATETYLRWWLTYSRENAKTLGEMRTKHGVNVARTPTAVLLKQLETWDAIRDKFAKEDPFFAKVARVSAQVRRERRAGPHGDVPGLQLLGGLLLGQEAVRKTRREAGCEVSAALARRGRRCHASARERRSVARGTAGRALGSARAESCEILIAGGGTGGVAAALAAARSGRRVVLLEETDWLGGQMTAQGVSALDEHEHIESFGGTAKLLQVPQRNPRALRRAEPGKSAG